MIRSICIFCIVSLFVFAGCSQQSNDSFLKTAGAAATFAKAYGMNFRMMGSNDGTVGFGQSTSFHLTTGNTITWTVDTENANGSFDAVFKAYQELIANMKANDPNAAKAGDTSDVSNN